MKFLKLKLLKSVNLLAVGVALSFVSTGCNHKKPPVTNIENSGLTGGENGPGSGEKIGGETLVGGGPTATFDPDQMAQDRTAFGDDTVYFDYDSSTIKGNDQSKLSAVASRLSSDASAKLLVEGNCDERGTEEYNRSLGERRALAAREALAGQGIDANRIATRSYGQDHPAEPGHNETAWSKNRRDEFVLLHAK